MQCGQSIVAVQNLRTYVPLRKRLLSEQVPSVYCIATLCSVCMLLYRVLHAVWVINCCSAKLAILLSTDYRISGIFRC